jgi:hypothetical protein
MKSPPKLPNKKKTWKDHLRPLVQKLEPTTKIAERVASLAVHLQGKPTTLGMVGLASAGVNAVRELIDNRQAANWSLDLMLSRGHTIEAFQQAGATIRTEHGVDRRRGNDCVYVTLQGENFIVDSDGSLLLDSEPNANFTEWLRQIFDRSLPNVLELHLGTVGESYQSQAGTLTALTSKQGPRILDATQPLLEGGRCILLEGRPGCGKTTCSQEIAARAGLGRTLLINPKLVGDDRESSSIGRNHRHDPDLTIPLQLLSPGVVIVDDIDKVLLNLRHIEALRRTAKLVILTANNGQHDEVLDAAIMRAGRVDEVFTITPEHSMRRVPFDQLDDALWEEVRDWPIAYLNEVEKRLRYRSGELRIEDLRDRVSKKTRSVGGLYD